MKKYILTLLTLLILSSTITAQKHRHKTHLTQTMFADNLRSDTVDVLKYTINLNITDIAGHTIAGNTVVKFTPKINGVTQLRLDLLVLTIDSIKSSATVLTYNYNDTVLSVNLPAAMNIGDTNAVTVYYHGTPAVDHPGGWGGFIFQSGYAYNIGVAFQAQPHNYGRAWFPCFDNFVERSVYEFNITTNSGNTSYCNGYLAHDTTDGSGNRTRQWIMDKEIQSYLASVDVAAYAEVHQSYNSISGSTIPIVLAALPADTTNLKNSFVNLPVALSTFENRFGPYRWNKVGYSVTPFSGGAMEHATNINYPLFAVSGSTAYQASIMAHELSHHWFGDLATCRTAEDMWLNEGWASYCEYIFTEGLSGYSSYLSEIRANHAKCVQFLAAIEGGYQTISNIPQSMTYGVIGAPLSSSYKRGADIAHTLRGYMGDSLFFYSVKTYLSNHQYTDVSSADLRDGLIAASGMNLNDFFNNWVFNPGWPHFSIDSILSIPFGSDYRVTVYVKQKLTGAPSYFNSIPLEVTFKAANWAEQTQSFVMPGATGSFNFVVPFNPEMVSLNVGEKISHAVVAEYKTLKVIGGTTFSYAKMTVTPTAITDSALVRVEHNFTAPDAYHSCCIPYRMSPNHYWTVDGLFPVGFKAKAVINYDGRSGSFSGNEWLDNNLINANEDSLVLLYRANTADEWHIYPFYTKSMGFSHTDKIGSITIDTLQKGQYVFAMRDYALGIANANTPAELPVVKVFPNPANEIITVDTYASMLNIQNHATLTVVDSQGKEVYTERISYRQNSVNINTSALSNGVYFITIKTKDAVLGKNKFIVSH